MWLTTVWVLLLSVCSGDVCTPAYMAHFTAEDECREAAVTLVDILNEHSGEGPDIEIAYDCMPVTTLESRTRGRGSFCGAMEMAAGLSIGFDVDFKRLERQMDDIGRKALPKAAAGWLNGIAFEARKQLIEHNKEAFDRPVPFTNRAWVVDKAKPADGGRMSSEVRAQPVQAAYLQYQIFGGERGAGDPGSGKWDVFAHADKLTRAGGVDKGFLLRTSKRHREERKARAELRKKRIVVRQQKAGGQPGPFPDYRWVTHSRNRPGIFFGEVDGLKGYWERPKRTKAAKKRKRGVITVRPRGSNRPKLLVAMKDSVRYKSRYRYDLQIMRAIATAGTAAAFQRELSRALSRR